MPRIAAATLHEHRELMLNALIDAAAAILRDGGTLTAGGVTQAAGIARNSLYRYVESVDDLLVLVLNKHLPRWSGAVAEAMRAAASPHEQVTAYVRRNLEQAGPSGHAWLMRIADRMSISAREELAEIHQDLGRMLGAAVIATGTSHPELLERIINGIIQAGFTQLEAGDDPEEVTDACVRAAAAVLPSQ